jgi:hypothetical protein
MSFWSSLKSARTSRVTPARSRDVAATSSYIAEYVAAIDRTERFGFEAPPRVLVRKDCVDNRVLPVLLEYYDEHSPGELMGQTLAIHLALVPRLYEKTGVHFNLTVGWFEYEGESFFRHDEGLIRRFVENGSQAWLSEGVPFQLWMTSLACEIVDITFAMNTGQSRTREECAKRVIYQCAHDPPGKLVYHPTVVGPDFFRKTGAIL